MTYNTHSGAGIRSIRDLMCLSQANMAGALGISPATLSKLENTQAVPWKYQRKVLDLYNTFLQRNPHIRAVLRKLDGSPLFPEDAAKLAQSTGAPKTVSDDPDNPWSGGS